MPPANAMIGTVNCATPATLADNKGKTLYQTAYLMAEVTTPEITASANPMELRLSVIAPPNGNAKNTKKQIGAAMMKFAAVAPRGSPDLRPTKE